MYLVISNNWVLHAWQLFSIVNYEKVWVKCYWCGTIHYSDHELIYVCDLCHKNHKLALSSKQCFVSLSHEVKFLCLWGGKFRYLKMCTGMKKTPRLRKYWVLRCKWSCKYVTLVYIKFFCFFHKLLKILSPLYKRRTPLLRWVLTFCNVPLIARGSVITTIHKTLNIVAHGPPNAHGVVLMKVRGAIGLRMWRMGRTLPFAGCSLVLVSTLTQCIGRNLARHMRICSSCKCFI